MNRFKDITLNNIKKILIGRNNFFCFTNNLLINTTKYNGLFLDYNKKINVLTGIVEKINNKIVSNHIFKDLSLINHNQAKLLYSLNNNPYEFTINTYIENNKDDENNKDNNKINEKTIIKRQICFNDNFFIKYYLKDINQSNNSLNKSKIFLKNSELKNLENKLDNINFEITPLFALRGVHNTRQDFNDLFFKFKKKDHLNEILIGSKQKDVIYKIKTNMSLILNDYNYYNFRFIEDELRGYYDYENLYTPFSLRLNTKEYDFGFLTIESEKQIESDSFINLKDSNNKINNLRIFNNRINFDNTKNFEYKVILDIEELIFKMNILFNDNFITGFPYFPDLWTRDFLVSSIFISDAYKNIVNLNKKNFNIIASVINIEEKLSSLLQKIKNIIKYIINNYDYLPNIIPNENIKEKDSKLNVDSNINLDSQFLIFELYNKIKDIYMFKDIIDRFEDYLINLYDMILYTKKPFDNLIEINNGLVYIKSDLNLTWMDAMINDKPIIDRKGYCVEINAMMLNTLETIKSIFIKKDFKNQYYSDLKNLNKFIKNIEQTFITKFYNDSYFYLYDVLDHEFKPKDKSIRPNQLFALSLTYPCIKYIDAFFKILKTINIELNQKIGLLSLNKKDKNFRGFYRGDQIQRDLSYHNGMIWPWLIGLYYQANSKIKNRSYVILDAFDELIKINENYINSFNEIFDINHNPKGCYLQAWNIAAYIYSLSELLK